jgi:hypothetical protein
MVYITLMPVLVLSRCPLPLRAENMKESGNARRSNPKPDLTPGSESLQGQQVFGTLML